jgi:peptidoglycan hydrolase-like protein with peptidoglycan-binding domain
MKLQGRVLSLNKVLLTGPDVDRLHGELGQLDAIYKKLVEKDASGKEAGQFGEATKRAVTAFQEANLQRLQAVVAPSLDGTEQVRWSGNWGEVDPATAQLINDDIARIVEPFIVRGRVEYEDGAAAEGIRVRTYDRDLGTDRQELGASEAHVTNVGGVFPDIRYFVKDYTTREGRRGPSADLIFGVSAIDRRNSVELVAVYRQLVFSGKSEELPVSDLILGFPASRIETVRLVIRRKGQTLPSEYERIMSALQPLLADGMTPAQFDEVQHRDLTFAARETAEDRAQIETMSQAWKLSTAANLRPELFYGLLRHDAPTTAQPMPADLPGVLSFGRVEWNAKLTEAFDLNVIPASMRGDLTKWLDQLQDLRSQATVNATPDKKKQVSIANILTNAGIRSDRYPAFATFLGNFEGPADEFWQKAADQLNWRPKDIEAAQNAFELAEAVFSFKPLLTKLYAGKTTPTARILATWDRQKLDGLVTKAGVPDDVEGDTPQARRTAFVDAIESRLQTLYPAEYLAKTLRSVRDGDLRKAGDWLHQTISRSITLPRDVPPFDVVNTPATKYLREYGDRLFAHKTEAEAKFLQTQLKRVQRVYQLSATIEQMPLLLAEGLDSASQIVRWSHEHFLKQYADRLGGAVAAAAVHAKAAYIHGTLLNLYIDIWKAFPVGAPKLQVPPEMHTAAASVPIPTIDELFGTDDLCSCADCLSVLSPAAYFVDLLQFLDVPIPGQPTTNLTVLLARRPDLAHIQLTCENTNTRIPYVDLVNEILASYVANGKPFPYNDPKDGVTTGTAEELRVNPISLTNAITQAESDAYTKLSKVVFPFNLPFNHWLEVVRLYLGHFTIKRETLMRSFQPDTDLDTEIAIAAETLGLSPQEFEVVTLIGLDTASATIAPNNASFFGFVETAPSGTAPANHVAPEFAANDPRTEAVKAVQNFLKNISASPGLTPTVRSKVNIDGVFGPDTLAAVTVFRTDHGLPSAGGTEPGFWGKLDAEGHTPLSVMMSHVPMFLRQTGLSYDELVSIITSRFLNPDFNERVFFTKLGISAEEIMALIQSGTAVVPPPMLPKIAAAGLSSTAFLKRIRAFHSMLVLDSPPDGLCDIDQTTIRHMDGTLLAEPELLRLQQAIRLWRKLGWTWHEIDLVLTLFPFNDSLTLILRLADMKLLLDDLEVPVEQLTVLWGRIDTWDERSLFERLFRSKTAQSLDPLFALDDVRREIDAFVKSPGTPPLLKDHAPLLLAAFRVNAADLTLLFTTTADGNLNVENISAMYGLVVLARALEMPLSDLLVLRELCGIDPLKRPAGEIESRATAFVHLARAVQTSGFAIPQLDYLLRHRRDVRAGDLQTPEQQRDLIGTLRAGLEEIQREYVLVDDPTGDKLVRQLGAVLTPQVAETLSRMIYGRFSYTQLLVDFPPATAFPALVASKLRYDADRQELRFSGVMTAAEQTALKAIVFVNSLPVPVRVPYAHAIDDLFAMPETFAKEKLFDLMDATSLMTLLRNKSSLNVDGTVDLATVGVKVKEVLAQVRRFLSMSLIKRTLSDAFAIEGPIVTVLLQDAQVLKALNVPGGIPAIEDFVEMPGIGLRTAYFNNATLTGVPVVDQVEAFVNFDGSVAVPAGVGPTPFSVRWTGYVFSPLTEDFTFLVRARDAVRVWLNGALVLDEWKTQPLTEFLVMTKLRQGSLNQITIEHAHFAGALNIELWWRSPSTELALVPTGSLYTEGALQAVINPLERLEKIAVIAKGFQLTALDIQGVSRLGYLDWNDVPIAEPATPAVVVALFDEWKVLQQFASVRDQISKKEGQFVNLLASGALDEALDRFADMTGADRTDLQKFADASTRHPFNAVTSTYSDEPPNVKDTFWWLKLRESCRTVAKTGCSADQIVEWGTVKNVTRIAPAPPFVNWYAMSLAPPAAALAEKQGQDLKRLVKARYDESTWRLVARPLNDILRMRNRDALIAFVQGMEAILQEHYRTADELFEFFLIDVKMDPCMETSRIQQGIATIQLFIQRALMGLLETEVLASSIDRQLYERMQSYAIWQPSREILIHTEKYIRWDLLDRKSEAYAGYEQDIRKQDLTQIYSPELPPGGWAETAFMNFLEKVDEVAKLEICGQYDDIQEKVLHVFARTHNAPYRYYYRRSNQFEGVGFRTGQWTAWEQIPLDIEAIQATSKNSMHLFGDNDLGGVHLIPKVWNRRLFLFWPQFRQVPDEEYNQIIPQGFDRVNRWEIKLAWSELWNGAWTSKQVSMSSLSSRPFFAQGRSDSLMTSKTMRHATPHHDWVPDPTSFWDFVPDPFVQVVHHFIDGDGGHFVDTVTYEPGIAVNELVPEGLEIPGEKDYAAFRSETHGLIFDSYLPDPGDHLFFLREIDGRLIIAPAVRYSTTQVLGKERSTTNLSLTVMLDGKVTFRERTNDPVEKVRSSAHQEYAELGIFRLGSCKVRDVEAISTSTIDNYYLFSRPAGADNWFQSCLRASPLMMYFAVGSPEKIVLNHTPPVFRVLGNEDISGFQYLRSFFFQDRDRVYLVTPMRLSRANSPTAKQPAPVTKERATAVPGKSTILELATAGRYAIEPEFVFQLHCHPQICEFIRRLNQSGLFALLATSTQQLSDTKPSYFEDHYKPSAYVYKRYPDESVDFDLDGAYSQYNWELFLYAPMRAWAELLRNYQFSEAEAFLKTVADITSTDTSKPVGDRIWQFKPFQTTAPVQIQEILGYLAYTGADPTKLANKYQAQVAVQEWLRDPFNPHLIARRRVSAYMQAVMLDCCRHYLTAADFEFTKYTMESIPRALQYLIIVVKILGGKRPTPGPSAGNIEPETFASLKAKGHLSTFSQLSLAIGDLETELPFTHSVPAIAGSPAPVGSIQSMYFCIPPNDEWTQLWDTVADRLFKIRHCMNIEGMVQELPLFPEPIDPMLLVEARAKGIDISSVFDDFRTPLPHHEFSVIFEKALRMVEDVKSFAQRFESLVEKSESEGLAEMRVEQEAQWLKDYLRRELVQTSQLQTAAREAIEKTRNATQARLDFYDAQIKAGLIEDEKTQRSSLVKAGAFELTAQVAEVQASIVSLIPETHAQGTASGSSFGGTNMGNAYRAIGGIFHAFGGSENHTATVAALNALWERRRDEWSLQRTLASVELERIDKELLVARMQESVASLRIENHDKTTANTEAVIDYYRQRFFNSDQYSQVAEDLYPDFFQLFQLAYDYARQAEACCRFQHGLTQLNIIQFGYWNNARKGLLAGEHLHLALKQLERVYLDNDKREYEIRRDVSLVMLDPQAFITLKQTGHCEFEIPETFFDGDYPGQFMRRLRGVSVTIPCVVGRYASVNCVLTLLNNKTRVTSDIGAAYEEDLAQQDKRFVADFAASQSIVTSHAQNDNGLFETDTREGRYLPFRGAGAVSRWRVDLPRETNAMDFNAFSDFLLHLPYTSREGGEPLRAAAWKAREKAIKDPTGLPQRRLLQTKFESRDVWHKFLHPDDVSTSQSLKVDLSPDKISTLLRERTLVVFAVDVYLNFRNLKDNAVYGSGPGNISVRMSQQSGGVTTPVVTQNLVSIDSLAAGTPFGTFGLTFEIKPDVANTLIVELPTVSLAGIAPSLLETIPGTAHVRLRADAVDDLWVVLQYSVK